MGLQITNRNGVLYVTGTFLSQRVRESTGLPKDRRNEAEAKRREIEDAIIAGTYRPPAARKGGRVATGDKTTVTFEYAADRYAAWKQREQKAQRETERLCAQFKEYFGDILVNEITNEDIANWVESMDQVKPGTIQRYMNVLRAIIHMAHEREWIAKVPKFPRLKVDDERDEHLSAEEANAFLEWVRDNHLAHYPTFLLLIDTGLRLSEALRVQWRDIMKDYLIVKRKVNGKTRTRTVPLSTGMRELRDWIMIKGMTPGQYVVRTSNGQRWSDATSAGVRLGKLLKEWCDLAGRDRIRVHDLRHTFAYLAAQAGADLGDLQKMMGHERVEMTLRYRGFMPNRSADVIQRLR